MFVTERIELSKYPVYTKKVNSLNYGYLHEGHGEAIIFLHGFPDHAGTWDPVIQELSPSHACIAPFLRGYYPTDIPVDHDYSILSVAEDIHLLATQLGYDRYSVVGQDWGASIAYVMANLYPENIRKVVALSMPHPSFLKPSLRLLIRARHILYLGNKKKASGRLSRAGYRYLDTLYKRWSPNMRYTQLKQQMVYCLEKNGRKEAALGYYWQLFGTSPKTQSLYERLPMAPTLTLVGKKDGTIDLGQFKKMETTPAFHVKYHPKAGHFLQREDPGFCVAELKKFLK